MFDRRSAKAGEPDSRKGSAPKKLKAGLRPRGLINRQTEKLIAAFLDGVPYDDPDFQDAIDKDMKRMRIEASKRAGRRR